MLRGQESFNRTRRQILGCGVSFAFWGFLNPLVETVQFFKTDGGLGKQVLPTKSDKKACNSVAEYIEKYHDMNSPTLSRLRYKLNIGDLDKKSRDIMETILEKGSHFYLGQDYLALFRTSKNGEISYLCGNVARSFEYEQFNTSLLILSSVHSPYEQFSESWLLANWGEKQRNIGLITVPNRERSYAADMYKFYSTGSLSAFECFGYDPGFKRGLEFLSLLSKDVLTREDVSKLVEMFKEAITVNPREVDIRTKFVLDILSFRWLIRCKDRLNLNSDEEFYKSFCSLLVEKNALRCMARIMGEQKHPDATGEQATLVEVLVTSRALYGLTDMFDGTNSAKADLLEPPIKVKGEAETELQGLLNISEPELLEKCQFLISRLVKDKYGESVSEMYDLGLLVELKTQLSQLQY